MNAPCTPCIIKTTPSRRPAIPKHRKNSSAIFCLHPPNIGGGLGGGGCLFASFSAPEKVRIYMLNLILERNDKNKLVQNRKDFEIHCNSNYNCSGNSGSPELRPLLV